MMRVSEWLKDWGHKPRDGALQIADAMGISDLEATSRHAAPRRAGGPQRPPGFVAMVIAESQAALKTVTVSMAVMELDLTGQAAIVFRNAAHGGLSVVYRRSDGNIGWIDPELTKPNGSRGSRLDH